MENRGLARDSQAPSLKACVEKRGFTMKLILYQ